MAGSSSSSNPPRARKRVEAETGSLKRAKDGSAFTRCEACNKDVPVVLIDMHSCSLDLKIRMNLESQVVENVSEVKKPAERKKVVSSEKREKTGKREKKMKDPNMPKRPPTAFFLFMDDFRKTFKEENPDNKSVSVVAKEGGAKWKSMTDEEKKVFVDRVAELKAEYNLAMEKLKTGAEEDKEAPENEEEDAPENDEEDT